MPTPHITPPGNAIYSTWQIGTYNAVTDTFTVVLDLNDRTTWYVRSYDLPQPEKVVSRSGNPRTQGERITNETYKNRFISLTLLLRSTSTIAAIDSAIHTLEAAIDTTPFMIRFAEAGAAQYSYAIVKSWQHSIPQDSLQRQAKVKTGMTIVFECEPGLLGDKLYLDNLVVNPGFEAPSGPGVAVFNDGFANVNAYTVVTGSAPTVAANVMSVAAGTTLSFGSPAWGAINTWQVRFKWVTGLTINFCLHGTGNNKLFAEITTNAWTLNQTVAGSNTVVASAAPTTTNGNFYWAVLMQFPITPGNPPMVSATLYNDSAGSIGTVVSALGPATPPNGGVALSGKSAFEVAGATAQIGGVAVNNPVQFVSLFGPGGWIWFGTAGGSTGLAACAWEQSTANTYPNGPVTSYGAARIDLPPAGTVTAGWTPYTGGAPAGTNAIPASTGQVLGLSAQVKSTGLHATNASMALLVNEYDGSGAFLRQDSVQSALGGTTNAAWTTLAGTVTPGASCAFIAPIVQVTDTSVAGESANGTVWFDNVQCWNQTTTGQTSMPYCELRFPQSPAQLMVSGLVGDVPAPAALASGSFASSLPSGTTISLLLGRRALAHAGAYLIGYPHTYVGSAGYVTVLDSTAYGGYYWKSATGQTSDQGPRGQYGASVLTAATLNGIYQLLARTRTSQLLANLRNLSSFPKVITFVGFNTASLVYPAIPSQFSASNTWTRINHGTTFVPPYGVGSQGDISQISLSIVALWADSTGGGSQWSYDAPALLPIDAETLAAVYTWPSGMAPQSNTWVYIYNDGAGVVLGAAGNTNVVGAAASWGWSQESRPLPAPQTQLGGQGTVSSPNASVNPSGAAYLRLDPTVNTSSAAGVNQMLASVIDGSGVSYGVACQFQYFPLYLDPR